MTNDDRVERRCTGRFKKSLTRGTIKPESAKRRISAPPTSSGSSSPRADSSSRSMTGSGREGRLSGQENHTPSSWSAPTWFVARTPACAGFAASRSTRERRKARSERRAVTNGIRSALDLQGGTALFLRIGLVLHADSLETRTESGINRRYHVARRALRFRESINVSLIILDAPAFARVIFSENSQSYWRRCTERVAAVERGEDRGESCIVWLRPGQ